MPKYLIKANYTLEGLKGVRAKGAKSRADVVGNMVNGMGGTVESFYFAFGDDESTSLPNCRMTRARRRSRSPSVPPAVPRRAPSSCSRWSRPTLPSA